MIECLLRLRHIRQFDRVGLMYVAEEASFRPGEPELICGLTSPKTSESEIVANETFIWRPEVKMRLWVEQLGHVIL